MKFSEFREKTSHYPFFRSNLFPHMTENVPSLRCQVSEWVEKGQVIALKRGMYTLLPRDRSVQWSPFFLAQHLYTPSYISLESALGHYGLIPEAVYGVTSVSPKKTQCFENVYGAFYYHHIDQKHFCDFVEIQDQYDQPFLIACPERAIVDFFYFKTPPHSALRSQNIFDLFENSFRLQNLHILNERKIRQISRKFHTVKMDLLIEALIAYKKEQ